jgi:uncharacterized protein
MIVKQRLELSPRRERHLNSPGRQPWVRGPQHPLSPGRGDGRQGPGPAAEYMDIEELRSRRAEILRVAARRGASHLRVFGSIARGQAVDRSDIVFLVHLEPGRSLLDLGGLLMDLRTLLGRPVDVFTEKGLKARIRDRALKEAVPL